MEKVSLKKYPYTISTNAANYADILKQIEEFKNACSEIKALHEAGKPVYVEVTAGDWKGSIAEFEIEKFFGPDLHRLNNFHNKFESFNFDGGIRGRLYFKGRQKPIQGSTYNGNLVWLKNYRGPTLYKKVDKKAIAEKIKAKSVFADRDGNALAIGDSVLYVNIRYGSGSRLERGTVSEIIVKAGYPSLVIERADKKEKSTISNTRDLIIKG